MGYLLIVLGLLQFGEARCTSSRRALLLGAGLVLAGSIHLVQEGSALHDGLLIVTWPVLLVALLYSWQDGSLGRTYLCWRRGLNTSDRPGHPESSEV